MDFLGNFDTDSGNFSLEFPDQPSQAPLTEQGDYRAALIGVAYWKSNPDQRATTAQLINQYSQQGDAALSQLSGRFACVIVNLVSREIVLAIDKYGIERVCFSHQGSRLVFSNDARLVAKALDRGIADQQIFNFFIFHMIPAPGTIFEGVSKLEPAELCSFKAGRLSRRIYWSPNFVQAQSYNRATEAELKHLLKAGVERAYHTADPSKVGSFLSGGLDSTTVTGYAQQVSDHQAPAFSIGFGEPGYDELDFARAACKHFGAKGIEYVVTAQDVLDSFSFVARHYDEPFGNSSALPTLYCARLAKEHGMTTLLAGDGGDEIFGGNERYAREKLLNIYSTLPGGMRRSVVDPLAAHLSEDAWFPLRKFKSYVEQASIPLPERLQAWNFFYREGRDELHADFVSRIDPRAPIDLMQQVYDRVDDTPLLNRLMAFDWHFTLADSDLRKVNTMCRAVGIEVEYPMLDERLLDFSCSLRASTKLKGLKLRAFYRKSLSDFLPASTLNKSKQGFGLPFGIWLQQSPQLKEKIQVNLGNLKQRGYFAPSFIDRLIAMDWEADFSYYGYVIWDLAVLEEWLSANA